MRTVLVRRLVAITALLVIALGTWWVVDLNVAKGLSWSVSFSAVATLVVTVALAAVSPVRRLFGLVRWTLPFADTTLAKEREDLAGALATEWAGEEQLRRINDPWPLPVRWSGQCAGQFDEIGEVYAGLPSRRLVILGPAGAGKTALAVRLVRELLLHRQPGDAVPILLAAATWTDTSPLIDWVAGQLALGRRGLDVLVRTGTGDTVSLARTLAATEVLPVIDGLDELPEGRRAEVIAEVNAYGSDRPVVLTCRPDEYETAAAARPVTLATVIRLEPLAPADVRAYLEAATDAPLARWQPVFDAVTADPDGALGRTLTNPLMLWLARTVYEQGSTVAGRLADRGRFADQDALEAHLLAGFVPAAYTSRHRSRGFRCSPAQAQRWLGFLAARQNRAGAVDIAWWRLCLAEPGWSVFGFTVRTVLYTCVAWWALTWALARRGYWRAGAYTGHGHYRDLLLAGPLGRSVRPLTGSLATTLSSAYDPAADAFLRNVAAFGLAATAGVAVGAGLILGSANAFLVPVPQTVRVRLAGPRSAVLWRWLAIGVAAFLIWSLQSHREPIPAIASLWRTQLAMIWIGILTVGWILSSLVMPVRVSSAAGPDDLFRRTRQVYVLRCAATLTSVATVWLWAGTAFAIAVGAVIVASFGIVTVPGGSRGAWTRYREARFRLSVRRRLPWRTMSFLADAHRRGVLRQVGGVYQFRHIRLREQLAVGYSPWPQWLAPWVAGARQGVAAAWRLVRRRLAEWQSDLQSVTVDADTVSGTITPRSPTDSVRQQLVSNVSLACIGAGVTVALLMGLFGWYVLCVALILVAVLVVISARVRLRRHRAGYGVIPTSWTFQANSGGFRVSQDSAAFCLDMADIEYVVIRLVRGPDGSATEWLAVHALLRSGVTVPFPVHQRWLPLVWLTTTWPVNRALPELKTAIRRFPYALLAPGLNGLKQATATEYSASGTVRLPTIPWVRAALPSFAVSLLLFLLGQPGLGLLSLMVLLGTLAVCWYRLDQRAAMRTVPSGPWSLQVTPDAIDLLAGGVVMHFTPDDVEEADLRVVRGGRRVMNSFSAVQLRLRPGATASRLSRDGWFTPYPKMVSGPSEVPTDLIAALFRFAGHRFGAQLARIAKSRHVAPD